VGLGLRYDAVRSVWGSANLFVDALKWGRLRISSALAYNGYLKAFEARHFSFTYDTHDAEFILQVLDNPVGFRPGREISFFIRLKALPFDTPFGIGRRGQPIGTGTGREF
jgi:LPS-assembly protein